MTLRELWNESSSLLEQSGIDDGRAIARLLLMKIKGYDYPQFICSLNASVNIQEATEMRQLIDQVAKGVPLQYLLGEQEFMGYLFKVTEDVLIPRGDTEILVNAVSNLLPPTAKWVADVGTGSGIIAILLALNMPNISVVAIDISEEALQVAAANAANHRVLERISLIPGDMLSPLPIADEKYHAIVSNPPYISAEEMGSLSSNVLHEPHTALYGGPDGLDYYRQLTQQAPVLLTPRGILAVEIGWQQGLVVQELFSEAGFVDTQIITDYANRHRVVLGYRPDY